MLWPRPVWAPLPDPNPPDPAGAQDFQKLAAELLPDIEAGDDVLSTALVSMDAARAEGDAAAVTLGLDLAAALTEGDALDADTFNFDPAVYIPAAEALMQTLGSNLMEADAADLPVDFTPFHFGLPPDWAGGPPPPVVSVAPTPAPAPSDGGLHVPVIWIPAAVLTQPVETSYVAGTAAIAGVLGTLIFVIDAFYVFNALFGGSIEGALAAYGAYVQAWAARDPLNYKIWATRSAMEDAQQRLTQPNITPLAREHISEYIQRLSSQLGVLEKMKYTTT